MGMWWNQLWNWPEMLIMQVLMLLAWGGAGYLIYVIVRNLSDRPRLPASPRHVLEGRLARGDIDLEEFRARLAALTEVDGA